mmetsp:Transcript_4523/g.11234  ORF Transcript_4523/g.11234 Transcript_4523/m.11234 type:complete len:386 (+) Transcript_4523:1-1158(+)
MLDRIRYRFWLEVLNVCMGDFIPFRRRERPLVKAIRRRVKAAPLWATQFVYRLPSTVLGLLFYALLLASELSIHRDERMTVSTCARQRPLIYLALALFVTSFILSFYGFLPCFKFLLHSPGIRQLHQLTRYYHRATRPPNLIYVTDGGVQDCTGILQLMRRRRERIVLVLGAEDPTSELLVLRSTLEQAAAERLGSFYDPTDPRRDIRATLDDFGRDEEATELHLGIQYGWWACDQHSTGHVFIIKNRLPPSMEDRPVRPLLMKEDILSGKACSEEFWDMKQTQLASCCCDCCHTSGLNFGSRFPHVPNANQCMTPQMFNSLCRLGYDLSGPAVQAIAKQSPIADIWEDHVTEPGAGSPLQSEIFRMSHSSTPVSARRKLWRCNS